MMPSSDASAAEVNASHFDERIVIGSGRKARSIFVECTHTYHSDINTGIQRVVRNVLKNAPDIATRYGLQVVPVMIENGHFRVAEIGPVLRDKQSQPSIPRDLHFSTVARPSWRAPIFRYFRRVLAAVFAPFPREFYWYSRTVIAAILPFPKVKRFVWAPPSEFGLTRVLQTPMNALGRSTRAACNAQNEADDFSFLGDPAEDRSGDILLLLDSSWSVPLWNATRAFQQQGGMVIGVIYDLIPVTHPHACVQELTTAFTQWLREYCRVTDGTVTISRSVRDQFELYRQLCDLRPNGGREAPVKYFHLGSELDLVDSQSGPSTRIADVFQKRVPTFLMVGSIEPRKNHAFVLDAFEKLWADGHNVRVIFIGKQAWRTDEFLKRVALHPTLNGNLIIFRDASDAELEECYRNSDALVIASEIEGFGLPIVEAFQRALPVICSDIAVFREIAGDSVTFFDLDDPAFLVQAIETFLKTRIGLPRRVVGWLNWRESTEILFEAIDEIVGARISHAAPVALHGSSTVV